MAAVRNTWDKWSIGDVEFSAFISLDAKLDGQVLTEPVEGGTFAAYNKVKNPIELTVTLSESGEPDALQSKLDRLVDMRKGTELFSVITPEYEFENMSLESFSYSRKREDGVNVLTVEARCIEVVEVQSQTTNVPIRKSGAKNKETASKSATGKKNTEEKGKYQSFAYRAAHI